MKSPLIIFPFNGNGIEALECLGDQYNFMSFVDDTKEKQGKHEYGITVCDRNYLLDNPKAMVLAVPGSPGSYMLRRSIIAGLNISYERFATVIHPKASVSKLAKIGKNVLIMSGVVITSNAIIEDHVCILPNTVIHHDSVVGAYSLIGSNVTIAGNTIIRSNCYIGSGSSIMNNLEIGENSLVGIGTNVIRNVPSGVKVVGNPASIIK